VNSSSLNDPRGIAINNDFIYVTSYIGDSLTTFNLSSSLIYQSNISYNVANITNISKNSNVIFSCRAFDGTDYSNWTNSSQITILNSPPVMVNSSISPTIGYKNTTWQGSCQASDVDGDSLGYNKTFYLNNSINYNSQTSCYQESYNTANQTGTDTQNCGLNYSGTRQFQDLGNWASYTRLYDGTWSQVPAYYYNASAPQQTSDYNFTYVKPFNSVGAILQAATWLGSSVYGNMTVPQDCWDADSTYLRFVDKDHSDNAAIYCYNATGVHLISNQITMVGLVEEAVYWTVLSNSSAYNFTNISKNNNLTFQCQAFDGTNYSNTLNSSTIQVSNAPPITSTPTLLNLTPFTNENLTCTNASVTDIDGDSISWFYKWYDTGVLITGQILNTLDLALSGLNKADTIVCEIYANDSTNISTKYNSSTATIQNSPPTIPTNIRTLGDNALNRQPNMTWSKGTDADGDSVSSYFYIATTSNPLDLEFYTVSNNYSNIGVTYPIINNTQYFYRMRSYDGFAYSTYTSDLNFTSSSNGLDITNYSTLLRYNNVLLTYNLSVPSDENVTSMTFFIAYPNATVINLSGTNNSDKTQWTMNQSFLLDQNGTYQWHTEYFNYFGGVYNTSSLTFEFNVSDSINITPNSESASFGKGVLHQLVLNLTHNNNLSTEFYYNITIANQTNWTIQSTNLTLNTGYIINFTSSVTMPDGIYNGTVLVYRSTDNLLVKNISLSYSLSLLVGVSTFMNNTQKNLSGYTDETVSATYLINNTGDYDVTDCVGEVVSGGLTILTFGQSMTNTTILINQTQNLTVTFSPLVGSYSGYIRTVCTVDTNGNRVASNNTAYIIVVGSLRPVTTPPSGGGGGTTVVKTESSILGDLIINPSKIIMNKVVNGKYYGEIKFTNTGAVDKKISITSINNPKNVVKFLINTDSIIIPTSSGTTNNYKFIKYEIDTTQGVVIGEVLNTTFKVKDVNQDLETQINFEAVSYTHLTLPTIYSV